MAADDLGALGALGAGLSTDVLLDVLETWREANERALRVLDRLPPAEVERRRRSLPAEPTEDELVEAIARFLASSVHPDVVALYAALLESTIGSLSAFLSHPRSRTAGVEMTAAIPLARTPDDRLAALERRFDDLEQAFDRRRRDVDAELEAASVRMAEGFRLIAGAGAVLTSLGDDPELVGDDRIVELERLVAAAGRVLRGVPGDDT